MKKFLYILSVPATLILLGLLVTVLTINRNRSTSTADCPSLSKQQLSSERSLGLIIENRQVLAVKLAGLGEKNYSPPGGHLEAGETYQQALIRELQEEVDLVVSQADLSQFKVTCEPRYGSVERTYYYIVDKRDGKIAVEGSLDRLKWVSYGYSTNKKADSELKTALLFLKQADLID